MGAVPKEINEEVGLERRHSLVLHAALFSIKVGTILALTAALVLKLGTGIERRHYLVGHKCGPVWSYRWR